MLVHGQATRREAIKKDEGSISWAIKVRNRVWEFGSRDIIWQPLPKEARQANLVVLMQESRILSNYPLLLARAWGKRVAYWGHGKNFQADAVSGFRERWKRWLLTKIDWWFAYTSMTVDILRNAGYPVNRITQLDNAIDSDGFKSDLSCWTTRDVSSARRDLQIQQDAPVALFCGSLYPDKRLDIMIAAGDLVHERFPQFSLLVIGDGPSAGDLKAAAKSRPWMHLLGVKTGREKALYFRMADVMFNPGLVGLHIVDAFCAGLVMVTTKGARHSPEVAYLEQNVNGVMTGDSSQEYAAAVIELFSSSQHLAAMRGAALLGSEKYTIDNMVANFADGLFNATRSG